MPELAPSLKRLRLSGILDSLETRNREAVANKIPHTDFLRRKTNEIITPAHHRQGIGGPCAMRERCRRAGRGQYDAAGATVKGILASIDREARVQPETT